MGFSSPEELKDIFLELDDWEERYRYIIELGRELPVLDENFKTDEYKLFGCQSNVWLKLEVRSGKDGSSVFDMRADSDSQIVKGLVSLVRQIYLGRTSAEILAFDIESLFGELHLREHLTPGRSDGLRRLIAKISQWAKDKLF